METIKAFFGNDRFAEYVGIDLLDVAPGRARVQMAVAMHYLNGAIFNLGGSRVRS